MLLKYIKPKLMSYHRKFLWLYLWCTTNEKNKVEIARHFDALSLRKLSLATPILANLRIPKGSLSSCFITAIDDNIESIFYNVWIL